MIRRITTTTLLSMLMGGISLAAPKTLTGKITDTMCGVKHMMPGKSDAECTRECMKTKGSWSYGLVVGNKVYRLEGDKDKFAALAGKNAKVTGEVTGEKIVVTAVAEAN